MNHCTHCAEDTSSLQCPKCGRDLSDPDARLDDMIEKAAVPSLATLFRKAKDSGAIKPISGYGGQPAQS